MNIELDVCVSSVNQIRARYALAHARLWPEPVRQPRPPKDLCKPISAPEPEPERAKITAREVAEKWHRHDLVLHRQHISIEAVVEITAVYFGVSAMELKQVSRRIEPVRRRRLAICLAHEVCGASKCAIGRSFGLDHSTVIHSLHVSRLLIATDEAFASEVAAIRNFLRHSGGEVITARQMVDAE
jgi:Bacterial dnaA protein helix-turn-helix